MKRLFASLICLTVLSAPLASQTLTQTNDTVLEIHRFGWAEATPNVPCDDCGSLPQAAKDYRWANRSGRNTYSASASLKNTSQKTIRSVNMDVVFLDAATQQEFLRHHLRFDHKLSPGARRTVRSQIATLRDADKFSPVGPSQDLLRRTLYCEYSILVTARKNSEKQNPRKRGLDSPPCLYQPVVTRIDYTDGSFWQP